MSDLAEKKALKYQAILSAAEQLMAEKGLHALNMNSVAKAAKVAKGTLYLYFKSREEIIVTLSTKAWKIVSEAFHEAIKETDSTIEQLQNIVRTYYQFLKEHHLYYELVALYEINDRPADASHTQQTTSEISTLLISLIEQGQANGEINPSIHPLSFSYSMWGMTVGIVQLLETKASLIALEDSTDEQRIMDTYLASLEASLRR